MQTCSIMFDLGWRRRFSRGARVDPALADLLAQLDTAADRNRPIQPGHIETFAFGHVAQAGVPFPFHAAIAILRAARLHPRARVMVFADGVPSGAFWDLVASAVELILVAPFERFGKARVVSAHLLMDIVRLLALSRLGGVFAATDMMILQALDALAEYPMVLGTQASVPVGRPTFGSRLAVARRDNPFCRKWLDAYESDVVVAGESRRNDLATRLPVRLYADNPDLVHVLRHDAWFAPSSPRARQFLFDAERADSHAESLTGRLALPLWSDTLANDLAAWTPQRAMTENCLFARLCRDVLPGSVDDNV